MATKKQNRFTFDMVVAKSFSCKTDIDRKPKPTIAQNSFTIALGRRISIHLCAPFSLVLPTLITFNRTVVWPQNNIKDLLKHLLRRRASLYEPNVYIAHKMVAHTYSPDTHERYIHIYKYPRIRSRSPFSPWPPTHRSTSFLSSSSRIWSSKFVWLFKKRL